MIIVFIPQNSCHMKTIKRIGGVALVVFFLSACSNNKEGRFLNLSSGEEVLMVEDKEGRMVDKETGEPVLLYVNTRTSDTIYGPTGKVVNGHLEYEEDGVYVYNDGDRKIKIDGEEYKRKDGDSKLKKDLDGDEYKYKDGEVTIKRDGDDYKEERKGYTKKVDEDGDVKIETKDKKYKIDGETGERKVKDKTVFSKIKDKVTGQ